MKTKDALHIAIVRGLAFALVTLAYIVIGGKLQSALWCVYVGFFLTMAFGAKKEELPNYLCSFLFGYVWVFAYYGVPSALSHVMPADAATVIAEFLVTGTLLFVHLRFLSKTWLNKIPAIFAGVATVFAFGGVDSIPIAAVSGCVGICMAIGTGVLIDLWNKK